MSSTEESSDHDVGRTRKCYSFKYRIRWFNLKGAALVLLWIILISASVSSLWHTIIILTDNIEFNENLLWIPVIIAMCVSFLCYVYM